MISNQIYLIRVRFLSDENSEMKRIAFKNYLVAQRALGSNVGRDGELVEQVEVLNEKEVVAELISPFNRSDNLLTNVDVAYVLYDSHIEESLNKAEEYLSQIKASQLQIQVMLVCYNTMTNPAYSEGLLSEGKNLAEQFKVFFMEFNPIKNREENYYYVQGTLQNLCKLPKAIKAKEEDPIRLLRLITVTQQHIQFRIQQLSSRTEADLKLFRPENDTLEQLKIAERFLSEQAHLPLPTDIQSIVEDYLVPRFNRTPNLELQQPPKEVKEEITSENLLDTVEKIRLKMIASEAANLDSAQRP